jgi:hypothetical protein
MKKTKSGETTRRLTYDAGALIAAEAGEQGMWALHDQAVRARQPPCVPAAVLAQAWRGGPQPKLSRLLNACEVDPMSEEQARSAGAACGQARIADAIDAAVVVGALSRGDVVVTSDPDDLRKIADALGHRLPVEIV